MLIKLANSVIVTGMSQSVPEFPQTHDLGISRSADTENLFKIKGRPFASARRLASLGSRFPHLLVSINAQIVLHWGQSTIWSSVMYPPDSLRSSPSVISILRF